MLSRLRHRALSLLGVVVLGCGYPEFRFAPDAAPETDTGPMDATTDAGGDSGVETAPEGPPASCLVLHERDPSVKSGTYTIDPDAAGPIEPFAVFCEMVADGGGWTLALKVDGSKTTFAYDASYWTNAETLNPGSTNLDAVETKSMSFSTVPFRQLRLGMREGGVDRFATIAVTHSSLRAAFSGARISTIAGRDAWLKLLGAPVLQPNCNDEGLNIRYATGIAPRVRIGIIGNEQADCATPDSYIGIGAEHTLTPTCFGIGAPPVIVGNLAREACGSDADRTTFAFALVFVR